MYIYHIDIFSDGSPSSDQTQNDPLVQNDVTTEAPQFTSFPSLESDGYLSGGSGPYAPDNDNDPLNQQLQSLDIRTDHYKPDADEPNVNPIVEKQVTTNTDSRLLTPEISADGVVLQTTEGGMNNESVSVGNDNPTTATRIATTTVAVAPSTVTSATSTAAYKDGIEDAGMACDIHTATSEKSDSDVLSTEVENITNDDDQDNNDSNEEEFVNDFLPVCPETEVYSTEGTDLSAISPVFSEEGSKEDEEDSVEDFLHDVSTVAVLDVLDDSERGVVWDDAPSSDRYLGPSQNSTNLQELVWRKSKKLDFYAE